MTTAPAAGHAAAWRYLAGYPESVVAQVRALLDAGRLDAWLAQRHPEPHAVRNDAALYDHVQALKARFLRSAPPLAKVQYVARMEVVQQALGTHTAVSRIQGARLKAKREIRVAAVFKEAPADLLQMIVVHELAHLKEPAHDRAFYALCRHMAPDYHAWELDTRVWLMARALAPRAPPATARGDDRPA